MFFKEVDDNYILSVSTGTGITKITESEYNAIMQKIRTRPTDPDGYTYKLRADNLEWELVELPPIEPADDDLTADEALNIILGGGSHET